MQHQVKKDIVELLYFVAHYYVYKASISLPLESQMIHSLMRYVKFFFTPLY